MIKRRVLAEVVRLAVVENLDPVEIYAVLGREGPQLFFAADQCDLRDAVARAHLSGLDGADIFALGQDDVLNIGAGTFANGLQDHKLGTRTFLSAT